MKKTVIRVSGILIVLLALAVAGMGFWSLGAVASEGVPIIRIEALRQPVEWKRIGEAQWKVLEAATEVRVGDEVRTGEGGKAEVRWGDRGVTRIDGNTELVIEEAPADGGAVTETLIRLRLKSGRVWSRVLKLLDVESGFDVRTDAVVATVRGTSFGTAKTGENAELAVTESVVGAAPAEGGAETLLKEGMWGSFSPTGTPLVVRSLTDADAWPAENRKLDAEFDAALRREIEERFRKRRMEAPEWIVGLSEDVHLALASANERPAVAETYARRRIAEAVADPSKAKTYLDGAKSLIDRYVANRDTLLNDVRFALFLDDPRSIEGWSPDLLAAFRDLRTALLADPSDPARSAYAAALVIDDDIDALVFGPDVPGAEKKEQATVLLGRIDAWQATLPSLGLAEADADSLNGKADAMRSRLIEFGIVLDLATATEDPGSSPSTEPEPSDVPGAPKPTGTAPKPTGTEQPTTPPPAGEPTVCGYRSLALFAKPSSNVNIGDAVNLSLYGVCPDGTTDNLTSNASFSSGSASDGSVSGNVFYPAKGGTITLYGAYVDAGVTKTGKTTIQVNQTNQGKRLTGVTAGAVGPTTLTTGQSAPLTATASYSDGSTVDVVYQCVWSTSDARLGTVSGQRFYAGTGEGQVSAICTYTDGGATVSGSVLFTVKLDPALTPTGGGGKPQGYGTYVP